MCLVWAVAGILDASLHLSPQRQIPLTLLYCVFFAGIIYKWCHVYAGEHGDQPQIGSSILAALLPPVGIPLYFFRMHSALRATFATLLALVFAVVLLIVYALAFHAAKLAVP
jgi:hypothetical protein